MTQSYLHVIKSIELFAQQHLQVQRFICDFRDYIPNHIEKAESFPILYVTLDSVTNSPNINTYDITVGCVVKQNVDRSGIKSDLNNCERILSDLYVWLRDGDLSIDVGNEPNHTTLNNEFLSGEIGLEGSFEIIVDGSVLCDIPFEDGIPSDYPVCSDAYYEVRNLEGDLLDSGSIGSGAFKGIVVDCSGGDCEDAIYELTIEGVVVGSGAIPSGDTQQIPIDEFIDCGCPSGTLTDEDGNYLLDEDGNCISGEGCAYVNYVVKYEDDTPIESGSVESGGSIEVIVPNCPTPEPCQDATAELYFDDALIDTLTIPSGDTDSFSIDCATQINAVRVESTELSHQHTGTFVLIGEENNKPKYEKVGDEDRIIRYDGTRWLLEKIGGGAHQHLAALGDEDFPWEADWADAYLLVSQATIGTYCANGSSAFYRLLDTEGNVILTGSIPSGDTSDITAPDATVENSDASYTDTVASGGTLVLPDTTINVTDQDNNILDTITFPVYSTVNIDIDSYCSDATAVLKDTDGNVLSTTDIPSGTTDDITAPDATYNLDNTSGATLFLGSILSGDNETIIAPDGDVENSDASYTASVESGGTLVLPDSDVNVNGNLEGTVVSVKDIDIDVTDGTNPVTPDAITISGNTVTIEVPAGGGAPVGATLMRTGQTTSYRTGDDADRRAEGRATDFFTLVSNNPFGNTNRFTDELGGSTYTNNIVIDWSTYDGATVLGWRRTANTANVTWNQAIDGALATSIGTFTSGWRLPNWMEYASIMNTSVTTSHCLNYAPFNVNALGDMQQLWTSTTPGFSASFAVFAHLANWATNVSGKTNSGSFRYMPCRTFTVTGTTLT